LVSTGPAVDSRECLGAVVSNGRIFYTSQASGFVVSQMKGALMGFFSHRYYFRRYQLNAAQYGEILVAEAFHGSKMGDAQRGYDILATQASFVDALRSAGLNPEEMLFTGLSTEIHIQVRSKLAVVPSGGKASVLHCKESDLQSMTHMAFVLVHPGSRVSGSDSTQEGQIVHACLMTRDTAAALRQKDGKVQYIRVAQTKCIPGLNDGLVDIKHMLSSVANAQIELPQD
jgi:hypothetical protein